MIAGRVVMLSRDQGLASIAGQLVGPGRPLTCFSSPSEVPDWLRPPTGAVVLDFPRAAREVVYRQLRQRYPGPVLALLDPEEDSSGLPTGRGRLGVLWRPFTGEELSASLDALVGSRNGARGSRSASPTVRPVRIDASAAAVGDPAWGAVGVPATRVSERRVAGARRRGPVARRLLTTARQRLYSVILTLAAAAALLLWAALGDGRDCRAARCGNLANAIENAEVGIPPASPGATPRQDVRAAAGPGQGASASPTAAGPPPRPSLVIPIASGGRDLISGTSSSSGAPLLVVTGGSGSPPPASGSGGGGSGGGGVPSSTTQPTATTVPPTTAPPTTNPPTTLPPTTLPPTTAPPTTEPPTTSPPTTAPPTTGPATTAAAPSATGTT